VKIVSPTPKFKAVLFDLGGTLVKTVEPPETYRRILEIYGVKASIESLAKAHRKQQEKFGDEEMAEKGPALWVKWNARVLERVGIRDNDDFLARKIDELWFDYAGLEIYSDVIEALDNLKNKKAKIGIVTNGFEKDYQKILQRLSLEGYFDAVVGIDACHKAKPHKEIFLCAINRLQVHPEETIFVGDSMKHDYEGAEKVGLKPLLILREGTAPSGVETITSLTQVLRYVY